VRAAAAICLAAMLFAGSAWADAPGPAQISPSVRTALLEQALKTARMNGERHPYDIEAVQTTRGRAIHLEPGTSAPNCEQSSACVDGVVYVVAMRGHFNCGGCPGPVGARAPQGTVITLEIEAPSMLDSSFALNSHYPNLGTLGAVVTLRGARHTRRR
jgi:hypothetical protein